MHGAPIDYNTLLQEDLTMFGRLVFSLACCNTNAWTAPQFQKSLDWMARVYKPEVKSVALYLISKPGLHKVKVCTVIPSCDVMLIGNDRVLII